MKPELFMRKERNAIDLFAAFMNVNSLEATEQNFAKLRKEIDRAEQRIMKEVRMKRMSGVSVGRHPYFQKRGSYDGEKMVVALRIDFNQDGMQYFIDISSFIERLGFKEKAMAVAARQTVEAKDKEFSMKTAKKPLNRDRRMKEILNQEPPKRRGEMPPPTKQYKDKTKYDRKRDKREYSSSKEYVIWGIPEGSNEDTLLLTRIQGEPITNVSDARKYQDVLEKKYGARKTRIQVIDLEGEFDWLKATGLRASEEIVKERNILMNNEKIAKELLNVARELVADDWSNFEKALSRHDWYYERSDDSRSYNEGRSTYYPVKTLSEKLLKEDPVRTVELWNKYSPFKMNLKEVLESRERKKQLESINKKAHSEIVNGVKRLLSRYGNVSMEYDVMNDMRFRVTDMKGNIPDEWVLTRTGEKGNMFWKAKIFQGEFGTVRIAVGVFVQYADSNSYSQFMRVGCVEEYKKTFVLSHWDTSDEPEFTSRDVIAEMKKCINDTLKDIKEYSNRGIWVPADEV